MNVRERLEAHQFTPDVVDTVSAFAEEIATHTSYDETFRRVGMPDVQKYHHDGYKSVDIIDVRPKEYDPNKAMLVHLAMANPLDPNQRYQIATIAGNHPNTRIIAAGNPSGPGYNGGRLTHAQRKTVAHNNLRPVVEPLVRYAEAHGISDVHQVGYSFGADRAATAAGYDVYNVASLTAIEPASVAVRSLIKLGRSFASSASSLEKYVQDSQTPAFEAARGESVGALAYNLGLARLSNLAVARALALGGFEARTRAALTAHSSLQATIAWGTESELASDAHMRPLMHRLSSDYYHRVHRIHLEGERHALANDIHLQAAIVLEGTKAAA